MKSTNYKNLALAGITAAVLTACSSGGTCGSCAIPVPATGSKLIFVAPSILPSLANTTGINYMGVYNPTTTAISNISYSLGQAVGTGSSVTLDPASAKTCANIAAKSSCFLKLSVPESTIAGGAVVTASNSDGTEAATPLAIGVQQVPYGESANANGVGLYFYPKAQYSESGVPFMLATAVVQSPNVGNINSIEIVDESGNLIADQYVTSGNSGVGAAPLTMGSVVEIMLPLPKGVNLSQNYKVRTSYQSAPSTLSTIAEKLGLANKQTQATSNQTTGTQVYTVTTQGNNINLQFTPNQVYLTGKNPVQYGYLYNIGDLTASQIQVSSSSPNVRVTAADQILNGQRVIKVTYELINTTVAPASNIVTVTAQNPAGQTQTSTGGTNQNVSPDVVPTPSPTPIPSPTPTPVPPTPPSPQRYAYVADYSNGVEKCTLTEIGAFSSCVVAVDTATISSPAYITFKAFNGTQYAWVGNSNGSYRCTLATDGSGDLTDCMLAVEYGSGASAGIQFATVNGREYIYFTQFNSNDIDSCLVNSDGTINSLTCNYYHNAAIKYAGLTTAVVNETPYLYAADYYGSGNTYQYSLNSMTGLPENEVNLTNTGISNALRYPYSLTFAAFNGIQYAYVTSYYAPVTKQCPVNNDGSISNSCTSVDNSQSWYSMSITAFTRLNNVNYAYLVDGDYDQIFRCQVDVSGLWNNCSVLDTPDISSPYNVAFPFN